MRDGTSIHQRVWKYASAPVEVLYRDFEISQEGCSREQVEKSRRQYGENRLSRRAGDTLLYRLRRAFINPFTVVLFVLALISFVTDVLLASNFSRDFTTPLIILGMLLLSGALRFVQELRSKRTADHLTSLLHSVVTVRREGRWAEISSAELVVGDRVRLSAGDRVPADLRLIAAKDLFVSQSVITGESAILEKDPAPLPDKKPASYAGYTNLAFMGSAVTAGSGEGVVLAVGRDTVYGGFSGLEPEGRDRFDQGANSIAFVLIRFMSILAPIVFLACGLTKGDWLAAFLFALSVAVGLTPEMLPMVINACLAKGSAAMGQKQTVVKTISAMQGFGSMDLLCVDKTGTLTGDVLLLEYYMDILGNESSRVLDCAYLNSLYHTGVANHLDAAILRCREMPQHQEHFARLAKECPKLDERPFDYERRIVSVLVKQGEGRLMIVKGGVEEVCSRCRYAEYRGRRIPMDSGAAASVHAVVDELLEDGMKVLAVACREVQEGGMEEQELTLLGYLAFFDAPKKTAADALRRLRELHVQVKVLTGDRQEVAASVCRRLGLEAEEGLTGAQLEALTGDERTMRIETARVFSELTPKQKAEIVKTLQANGHTVGFLGDGMNDLPAMVESDVGISVDNAAQAVQEGADVILLKKDLKVLAEGIQEGRRAFSNMSKYIRITASSNFGNILSIVVASVFLPFFPMTSVQLLLLNLFYDALCLVLPWDHVDKETCALPLEWSGRTLGRFMRWFGPVSSVFDLATFGFLYFVLCPAMCGGGFGSLGGAGQAQFAALFQTGWLLESMWTQILILHMLRTPKVPFVQSRPSAPVLAVTTLGILFFTALTFAPAGRLIGLAALPPSYFGFLLAVVALYLLLMTWMKRWYLKKYRELL